MRIGVALSLLSPAPPITAFVSSIPTSDQTSLSKQPTNHWVWCFVFSFHLVLGWNDGFEHGWRTVYH